MWACSFHTGWQFFHSHQPTVARGAFGTFPHGKRDGFPTMNSPTLERFPLFGGNSYIFPTQKGNCAQRKLIALVLTSFLPHTLTCRGMSKVDSAKTNTPKLLHTHTQNTCRWPFMRKMSTTTSSSHQVPAVFVRLESSLNESVFNVHIFCTWISNKT